MAIGETHLEEAINTAVDTLLTRLWKMSRDPWLSTQASNRVTVLASGIEQALLRYERLYDPCSDTDSGPTAADLAGEVQHDIG